MATTHTGLGEALRQLRRTALRSELRALSDADLLASFIDRHDEVAFEMLLRRHGPMVLGVCQRILQNADDAEDALQATFLVLVRKANDVRPRGLVGHWLYGVAYRTAMKAKAMRNKRRLKESKAIPRAAPQEGLVWQDVLPVLDRELKDLPEKYRLAVFLCDIEGKKHREAARQLGWPAGTLETRLNTGRRMLARRLARHGFTLSAAATAQLVTANALRAQLSPALLLTTIRSVRLAMAGTLTADLVSTRVIALAEGVMQAMLLNKIKLSGLLCLGLLLWCASANLFSYSAAEDPPVQKQLAGAVGQEPGKGDRDVRRQLETMEWFVKAVDRATPAISFHAAPGNTWGAGVIFVETKSGVAPSGLHLNRLRLAKDCVVLLNNVPAALADLRPDMRARVRFGPHDSRLSHIDAFSKEIPVYLYVLQEVSLARRTVSVSVNGGAVHLDNLSVAKDATIEITDVRGTRPVALKDLRKGMTAHLELAPNDKSTGLVVCVLKAN